LLVHLITFQALAISAVYAWLLMVLLVDAALFVGPLLVFTGTLWAARTKGIESYMVLAARYVSQFEAKWTSNNSAPGDALVGTEDLQSLADLGNSINTVKAMRWITIGPRMLTMIVIRGRRTAPAAVVVPISIHGTGTEVLLETGRLLNGLS
jgi:hypothetical protein